MEEKYLDASAAAGGDGNESTPWDGLNDITWGTDVSSGDTLNVSGSFTVTSAANAMRSLSQNYTDWVTVQGGHLEQAATPAYDFNIQWQDNDYLWLRDMEIGSSAAQSVFIRANAANIENIRLHGLIVDNSDGSAAAGHAVWVLRVSSFTVSEVEIGHCLIIGTSSGANSDGINAQVGNGLNIHDCMLRDTEAEGIDVSGGLTGVKIHRINGYNLGRSLVKLHAQTSALDFAEVVGVVGANNCQNYNNWGMAIEDVNDSTIAQCSIYQPGGGPLSALQLDRVNFANSELNRNVFRNNIFVADYSSGVVRTQTEDVTATALTLSNFELTQTWDHNCMWQSGSSTTLLRFDDDTGNNVTEANHATWASTHEGDINADPKFLDAANNDLRLDGDSPCIAAGINWWDAEPPTGEDGLRFKNIPSMGAYEPSNKSGCARKSGAFVANTLGAGIDIAKAKAA